MPDLSLLEPLAKALGVSVAELLSGEYRTNANRAGNLLRSQWYVCPVCGNVVYALGQGSFHCCGVALPPAEAEEAEGEHAITLEQVEDDYYVTLDHPMSKGHFLSFMAYLTTDRVLLQKTYVRDCISKQVVRNTGQLPMYLVQNNHEGIVDRKTFDAVQTEMARRNAGKSPSKKNASTGMTSYASKYALSERLVCGECGTLYRRCTWKKNGKPRVVWRCVSRLDYGRKYCHDSPTLDEAPLQQAILDAIHRSMSQKGDLIGQITNAMELELSPIPRVTMSLADIDLRLAELESQFQNLLAEAAEGSYQDYTAQFKSIADEMASLKEKRTDLETQRRDCGQIIQCVQEATEAMKNASSELTQWDESIIRQLVDTVKVLSEDRIMVYLRGGLEVEQEIRTSSV